MTTKKFCDSVVRFRYLLFGLFGAAIIASGILLPHVRVNYDITRYLPDDMETRRALRAMEADFGLYSFANVFIPNVTRQEADAYKVKLSRIENVNSLAVSVGYREGNALIGLHITGGDYSDEAKQVVRAVDEIMEGREYYITGSAVNGTRTQKGIGGEMPVILLISVAVILAILLTTSRSWFDPVLFLSVIGVSIWINLGSNFFLGEISYVTQSIAAVLQLALAMDYSIVYLHNFDKATEGGLSDPRQAASAALKESIKPIVSSGLTTMAGLVALMFMSFGIGRDIGLVMSKGILVSMVCVFFLMPGVTVLFARPLKKLRHKPVPLGGAKIAAAGLRARFVLPAVLACVILTCAVLSGFNAYSFTEVQPGKDTERTEAVFGNTSVMVVLVDNRVNTETKEKKLLERVQTLKIGGRSAFLSGTGIFSAAAGLEGLSAAEYMAGYVALHNNFTGRNYSRLIFTFDLGKTINDDTYAFIDDFKAAVNDVYGINRNLIAGGAMSNYDIAKSFRSDLLLTNLITVFSVLLIIGLTFRSVSLPAILVLVIQGAIFIATSFSFIVSQPIFFMSYLIASAILMGATIDYAILITNNYLHARESVDKRTAVTFALQGALPTVLTSGAILAVAGFIVGGISSSDAISTIGMLLGRGALFSCLLILFLLPELLYFFDGPIFKTSFGLKGKAAGCAKTKKRIKPLDE